MTTKWRAFPLGRQLLYVVVLSSLLGLYEDFSEFQTFLPTLRLQVLLGATGCVILAISCIVYDVRRVRRESREESGAIARRPRRWRDAVELRFFLYWVVLGSLLELPIAILNAANQLRVRGLARSVHEFWSVFHLDWLCWMAIAIAIIAYDRWRLKREAREDGTHCLVCGYDLRATPDRCPECGTIPLKRPILIPEERDGFR